jgi:hypothetical protein
MDCVRYQLDVDTSELNFIHQGEDLNEEDFPKDGNCRSAGYCVHGDEPHRNCWF